MRTSTLVVLSFLVSWLVPGPVRAETLTLSELNRQIAALNSQQKFGEALDRANKAVTLAEREFGPNNLTVAVQLETVGRVYRLLYRLANAEPVYRRALEILAKKL